MAVRKPPKGKKGTHPDQIPATLDLIKRRIANGETGVIEKMEAKVFRFS